MKLGRVLEDKGQYENALVFLKKGLAIREKIRPPGHPDIMSALAWIGVSKLFRHGFSTCGSETRECVCMYACVFGKYFVAELGCKWCRC